MTNFHDPKVMLADGCEFYTFCLPITSLTRAVPCSSLRQAPLPSGWGLHVSILRNFRCFV